MGNALWKTAFPKQARKLARHSKLSRNRRLKAAKASAAYSRQRKRINPISRPQLQALKKYKAERQRWQQCPENLRCLITGESSPDTHHTRGKIGDLLCLSALWLPVSRKVHGWIRDNPKLARLAGLLCPEGKWNTMPTPCEIKEHLYRVAWLRFLVSGERENLKPVRPELLATRACEIIEVEMNEVSETGFWLHF